MGNDWQSRIHTKSWIVWVWRDERNDVLNQEKEQSNDNTKFGSREECLDEKALNDKHNVEKDENDKGYNESNFWQNGRYDCTTDQVNDQAGNKVSDEPSDVVDWEIHAHNAHSFFDFLLFLGQHDWSLS